MLLGTEFGGANLMGANLYGAQGLWAGRLGGANLFDATLPEAVGAFDGGKTIGQFTQSARRFYLLLMGICVVACGLVALTTDVRLLLDESATVTARSTSATSPRTTVSRTSPTGTGTRSGPRRRRPACR